MVTSECPGCFLTLAAENGPTHAYVPTSPECWALFGRVVIDTEHRLISDAYMAQHPDGDDPRQLQSVAVHLITLQAILGNGQPIAAASRITAGAVALGKSVGGYPKLERPVAWEWNIRDVAEHTVAPATYIEQVRSAWMAIEGSRITSWVQQTLQSIYA